MVSTSQDVQTKPAGYACTDFLTGSAWTAALRKEITRHEPNRRLLYTVLFSVNVTSWCKIGPDGRVCCSTYCLLPSQLACACHTRDNDNLYQHRRLCNPSLFKYTQAQFSPRCLYVQQQHNCSNNMRCQILNHYVTTLDINNTWKKRLHFQNFQANHKHLHIFNWICVELTWYTGIK